MSFLIILHLTKTRFCLFSIWSNFFPANFRFMLAFAIEIRRKVLISSKKILFSESIVLKKEYLLICFLAEKHWEIGLFLPLNSLSRLYSFFCVKLYEYRNKPSMQGCCICRIEYEYLFYCSNLHINVCILISNYHKCHIRFKGDLTT